MATFPIKLELFQCADNNSSTSYVNDASQHAIFAAKAVDGCTFKENDGEHFYISRLFNGETKVTDRKSTRLNSSHIV